MNQKLAEKIALAFDQESSSELQESIIAEIFIMNQNFAFTAAHSPQHLARLANSLAKVKTESAQSDGLRLEALCQTETGKHHSATLTLEAALARDPENVDLAMNFEKSLSGLWRAFHQLATKEPGAPELSAMFEALHDRGVPGIETYVLAANHYLLIGQLGKAAKISSQLKRLMPNYRFLPAIQRKSDSCYAEPANLPNCATNTEKEISDNAAVAAAVAITRRLESEMREQNFPAVLEITNDFAKQGAIDKLNIRILYTRVIALDAVGELETALELVSKLLDHSPLQFEYLNSLYVICARLDDKVGTLLSEKTCQAEEVEKLVRLIQSHSGLTQSVLLKLASFYIVNFRYEEGIEIFDSILQLMPNDPDVFESILSIGDTSAPSIQRLQEHCLAQLSRCRKERPYDFRYWSRSLAERK